MKQNIYFCNNCATAFDNTVDDIIVCPNCGMTSNIDKFQYNTYYGEYIHPSDIIVRMNDSIKIWFYEMSIKLLKDILYIEVEVKNKRFHYIYNLNSIISNIKYLIDILGTWKTHMLTEGTSVFVYKGFPGCLISESDWKLLMESLVSIKHECEGILKMTENNSQIFYLNSECKPNWENLENSVTDMFDESKKIYSFFKYGVTIKRKL